MVMNTGSSPFGKYAALAALIGALVVLAAWIATVLGFAPSSDTLDAVALVVIGALFGTGAGATVVTNGAAHKAEAAHVRLDAVHAPSTPVAEQIARHGVAVADATAAADEAAREAQK